jgi:hypothetical protein
MDRSLEPLVIVSCRELPPAADPVLSERLGFVKRAVGPLQDLLRQIPVLGKRSDTDARGDAEGLSLIVLEPLDSVAKPIGDEADRELLRLRADHHELVAADARRKVDSPDSLDQELADVLQDLGAGQMAVPGVHLAKPVEIEKDERVAPAEPGGALMLGLERAVEESQVVERGEVVPDREGAEPL